MMFSFTVGSWVVPLLITIFALLWAAWVDNRDDDCIRIAGLFAYFAATVISLVSWLTWALLR